MAGKRRKTRNGGKSLALEKISTQDAHDMSISDSSIDSPPADRADVNTVIFGRHDTHAASDESSAARASASSPTLNTNGKRPISVDYSSIFSDSNSSKKPKSPLPKREYQADDVGPYDVYVSSTTRPDQSESRNLGNLFPTQVGRILKRMGVTYSEVKSIGRNRIKVSFSSYLAANSLLHNPALTDVEWEAYLPGVRRLSFGVVQGLDPDTTEEEILMEASAPDTTISAAHRLQRRNRDGDWVNCNSWRITFDTPILPDKIVLFGCVFRTTPYIHPVRQCKNCYQFGHSEKVCRSKPRCATCGHREHTTDECTAVSPQCLLCKGQHAATDRTCPKFTAEKEAKTVMARNNLSYAQATKQINSLSERGRSPIGADSGTGVPPPPPTATTANPGPSQQGGRQGHPPTPGASQIDIQPHTVLPILAQVLSALLSYLSPRLRMDAAPSPQTLLDWLTPLLDAIPGQPMSPATSPDATPPQRSSTQQPAAPGKPPSGRYF